MESFFNFPHIKFQHLNLCPHVYCVFDFSKVPFHWLGNGLINDTYQMVDGSFNIYLGSKWLEVVFRGKFG